MTANDKLMVFEGDEPPQAPVTARPPLTPLTPDEWAALPAADRLDLEVAAAAAARAKQEENAQHMAEQLHVAPHATPPEPPSDTPRDPEDSIVYGSQETVRVETVVYRTFVELDDGLVRAIPAGVRIAPTSMNRVVRRVQRAALISDAREDARDERAMLEARRITGHLEILQQDPALALPSPQDPALLAAEAAPDAHAAAAPRVISLEAVVREPDRFEVVDDRDPRVQRLLAARVAEAVPAGLARGPNIQPARRATHGPWHAFKRGLNAAAYIVTVILAIAAIMSIIPWTRPLVGKVGTWLYQHVAVPVRDRLTGKLPAVVPAVAGAPDEFDFKRAPSITCGQFVAAFKETPLATEAPEVCTRIARRGYDPAILGGMARVTMTYTSTDMLAEWQPAPAGRYNLFILVEGDDRTPLTFSSYGEAFDAFMDILERTYFPRNITSLPAFIVATCLAPGCDANVSIENSQQRIRDLRTPDPVASGTSTGNTTEQAIAEQSSKRVTLTITAIVPNPDGSGETRVVGKLTNISSETLAIPATAFFFYDKTGISYSMNKDAPSTTLAPGQSTPLTLDVPIPMDQPLKMQLVLQPDTQLMLELRK